MEFKWHGLPQSGGFVPLMAVRKVSKSQHGGVEKAMIVVSGLAYSSYCVTVKAFLPYSSSRSQAYSNGILTGKPSKRLSRSG